MDQPVSMLSRLIQFILIWDQVIYVWKHKSLNKYLKSDFRITAVRTFKRKVVHEVKSVDKKYSSSCSSSSSTILGPSVGCTVDYLFLSLSIIRCSYGLIYWKLCPGSEVLTPCNPRYSFSSWSWIVPCTISFSRQSSSFLNACPKYVNFLMWFSELLFSDSPITELHHPINIIRTKQDCLCQTTECTVYLMQCYCVYDGFVFIVILLE